HLEQGEPGTCRCRLLEPAVVWRRRRFLGPAVARCCRRPPGLAVVGHLWCSRLQVGPRRRPVRRLDGVEFR
ncbi:hypothetical protein, partial [Mycobacterium tuberculosis]